MPLGCTKYAFGPEKLPGDPSGKNLRLKLSRGEALAWTGDFGKVPVQTHLRRWNPQFPLKGPHQGDELSHLSRGEGRAIAIAYKTDCDRPFVDFRKLRGTE